jgi:hypothetical protein
MTLSALKTLLPVYIYRWRIAPLEIAVPIAYSQFLCNLTDSTHDILWSTLARHLTSTNIGNDNFKLSPSPQLIHHRDAWMSFLEPI